MIRQKTTVSLIAVFLILGFFSLARAEILKPFVLGKTPAGSMADVVEYTKAQLTEQGFTIVGSPTNLAKRYLTVGLPFCLAARKFFAYCSKIRLRCAGSFRAS